MLVEAMRLNPMPEAALGLFILPAILRLALRRSYGLLALKRSRRASTSATVCSTSSRRLADLRINFWTRTESGSAFASTIADDFRASRRRSPVAFLDNRISLSIFERAGRAPDRRSAMSVSLNQPGTPRNDATLRKALNGWQVMPDGVTANGETTRRGRAPGCSRGS